MDVNLMIIVMNTDLDGSSIDGEWMRATLIK